MIGGAACAVIEKGVGHETTDNGKTPLLVDRRNQRRPTRRNRVIGALDNGLSLEGCHVELVFRNIDKRIIAEIDKAEAVFGCVAWLTHEGILRALAQKEAVGIVVQKEDFLRPDSKDQSRARTRQLYTALPGFDRYNTDWAGSYDYQGDPSSDAVRCVGLANNDRRLAMPRMHNKFLVFCRWETRKGQDDPDWKDWRPYAVWTGSFNLTYNASESLENGVLIQDERAAAAYAKEFGDIFGLSERLDWSSEWVVPEYRVGS